MTKRLVLPPQDDQTSIGLARPFVRKDRSKPAAERGAPTAEYSQYGMVREGNKEAEGLTEEQIRGIQPSSQK